MNHIDSIAELITELNDRRIEALKARDKPVEAAYSYFLSIVKKAEKDGGQYQEALNALKKEEKALQELQSFARTQEEKNQTEFELYILSKYLPKMMTEDEIKVQVLYLGQELHPLSAKDKGKFMKEIMARLKGKVDGKMVNKCVNDYFNEIFNN